VLLFFIIHLNFVVWQNQKQQLKNELEKKRRKKAQEKAERKQERKVNPTDGQLENMLAYVNELVK